MKVGLVRRGYSPVGGAEAYLKRLAHALSVQGHEVVLFGSPQWPEADWPGSGIIRIAGNSPRDFADQFSALRHRADVILSLERVPGCDVYRAGDGVHAAWLERRAAFEPAWKRILRPFNRKHSALLALEASVFDPRNTRRIIANSQMIANEIFERHGFPMSRIDVIPNGVEASAFADLPDRTASRRQWLLADDAVVALFAGSGWERKGLRYAMAAAERIPWLTLVIAGRGRTQKKAPPNVRFVGPQKILATLFAAADIFVLPTLYDPFSNACLEAFAAGLPVITTKANGFSEILTPGLNGEAIEDPSQIDSLATALKEWGSPGRAAGARDAIRGHARNFTIEQNTRLTLETLASAIRQ